MGQLLEQWWEQLAQRLKGHTLLPELPGEAAQAFAEAWRLALAHAGTAAQGALTEEHNRLFAAKTSLTQERKLWDIALAEAQTHVAESAAQLTQAEAQLRERQALVDQLVAQVADVQQQRDHLQGQLERRQAELDALRRDHAAAQEHIRTTEDRTHQQVDQLRQELKAIRQQRAREQRDYDKRVARLTEREQTLLASLRTTEQTTAHQAGHIAALEATIAQWQRVQAPAKRATSKGVNEGSAKPPAQRQGRRKAQRAPR